MMSQWIGERTFISLDTYVSCPFSYLILDITLLQIIMTIGSQYLLTVIVN